MNSFGQLFRIQIYGESHGPAVGVIIDGIPSGIPLKPDDLVTDLQRRKTGAKGTSLRTESDLPVFISGVYNGFTTGSPLNIQFENADRKSSDYNRIKEIPRPGHADYVSQIKFKGYQDHRGGGHFSGRLTIALVAAGVIAKRIIQPVSITAQLVEAGGSADIDSAIELALEKGDSIGGIVFCTVDHMPVGLGEPFFNSLESQLSHIIFSIPAIKGIEFGSGFRAAKMYGSQHNDSIIDESGRTVTNNSGGINGGISNGNSLELRIAVKPTSSISAEQNSINLTTHELETFAITGRHDACIALRVPVVLEAAVAIVLADMILISRTNMA